MAGEGGAVRPTLTLEVLTELIDVAPTALIVTDAGGVVHLCNRAAAKIGGVLVGMVLGRPLVQALPWLQEFVARGGRATLGQMQVEVVVTERGGWHVLGLRVTSDGEPVQQQGRSRLREGRVLVVEDNLVSQRVTTAILERLGVRCEVVSNGREALARIVETPYDLVLMDCYMPELDGLAATRMLRLAEEPRRSLPVVALTSSASIEERRLCFAAGMDACLEKPVGVGEMGEVLARWLGASDAGPLDVGGLAELAEELGGKEEVAVLIERFLRQVEKVLSEMKAAERHGDLRTVGARAHGLVGSAGSLGAVDVATACRELERICRWPAPRLLRRAIEAVEAAFRVVEPGLRGWSGVSSETG